MRRTLPACTILALAGAPAGAQEPVTLRLTPAVGQVTAYRTELHAWLRTPLLAQADTAVPTVRIVMFLQRTVTSADSTLLTFSDVTDSSRIDLPSFGVAVPWLVPRDDLMHGLTTETRIEAGGRGVTTRVVAAPALPPELPNLIRGIVTLAITGTRLATFALPDHPVSPGDTWTDSLRYDLDRPHELEAATVGGGGTGTATFRFERLETRAGRRIAILTAVAQADASAQETAGTAIIRFSGTARVELGLDAGRLERAEMDIAGAMLTRAGMIPVRLHLAQQAR